MCEGTLASHQGDALASGPTVTPITYCGTAFLIGRESWGCLR